MSRTEAGVGLGSNLGDRLAFMIRAREALSRLPETDLVAASRLYETEPVGVREADRARDFLNAVVLLQTGLAPGDLAAGLRRIEDSLGRRRGANRYAPRTMDLDLLYYDGRESRDPALRLPHPQVRARRFVCRPLADLRPGLRLPGASGTVLDWLAALPEEPRVAPARRQWPPWPGANDAVRSGTEFEK